MTKQIKVLHLSTHNEECGIAKYQEQFLDGMQGFPDIENRFFEISPNISKLMSKSEYDGVLHKFFKELKEYEILHIQHELSFYKHKELESTINIAKTLGKKVVVTMHTAPEVEDSVAVWIGLNPRGVLHYLRKKKQNYKFEKVHLRPLRSVDLIMVHNNATKNNLIKFDFDPNKIKVIKMPVPAFLFGEKSTVLKRELKIKEGDIIYSTVGFLTRTKGIDQAVKALNFLPENYKLAIIGGIHPKAMNESFLDEICDYIIANNLTERVYITGYIEDDNILNTIIKEVDICVYPYDKRYYSYVSSASLSNAFANHKATVAYSTDSLVEVNDEFGVVTFCKSSNYYELAREIKNINLKDKSGLSEKYSEKFTYKSEASKLAEIYRSILG
jgi:glycosyltransferase involved in cell wall biosynthesis